MALTDLKIRTAKASGRVSKLSDGGGLQLWIEHDGGKRWRLAYRFGGKQKTLAMGVYWIVQGVWASGQVVLARSNDAAGGTVTRPMAGTVVRDGARKVSIDPIGRVWRAND